MFQDIIENMGYWQKPVKSIEDLPKGDREAEIRFVLDEGDFYWWNGNDWEVLRTNFDLRTKNQLIKSGIRSLDFVNAKVVISPDGVAHVYLPTNDVFAFFNTKNQYSDCQVVDFPTENRFISSEKVDTEYKESFKYPCISSQKIGYVTPNPCIILDNSSFKVTVFDHLGGQKSFCESIIEKNTSIEEQNIAVNITEYTPYSDKYTANIGVKIDLSNIFAESTMFSVEMAYVCDSGTFVKSQRGIFFDRNESEVSLGVIKTTIDEPKYVTKSGIKYLSSGNTININMTGISNIFDGSYVDPVMKIDCSKFGLPMCSVESYEIEDGNFNKEFALSNENFYSAGKAKIMVRNTSWDKATQSASEETNILIDTHEPNSTRIYEDFTDERFRLTSTFQKWDSSESLSTYDNKKGLQVGVGSYLLYPRNDFSYFPDNQYNYATNGGRRAYMRHMYHDKVSHDRGMFCLCGITENQFLNEELIFSISIDGENWLSCNKEDGCRTSDFDGGYFTCEFPATSEESDWGIYIRIEMDATSQIKLDKVEIIDWV